MSTGIEPLLPSSKPRTVVYIDGFNWYYSVYKHRPEWKWLNVQSFFEELRSDEEVIKIKYFSAIVDPNQRYSETRDRQKRYFKAFKSLPKVELILGTYQDRQVTCRARCREKYFVPEEKKTDVNIAVHILSDTVKGHADRIVLVTGDSDLQPAIAWVKMNYPSVALTVYIPALPEEEKWRRSSYYASIQVPSRFLPLGIMGHHLLPNPVELEDGTKVAKPESWI